MRDQRAGFAGAGILAGAIVALLLDVAVHPGTIVAQENLGRGRISGRIVDETGATIEGAKVIAESLQGNAKLEGVTDKKGHFAIAGLGTGMWRITAIKEGFVSASLEIHVTQLKTNPPVDLMLKKPARAEGFQADKAGMALIDQGNAQADQGNFDAAIALYQEFLTKYPAVYQARLNIASVCLKKGDTPRAEAEFKEVLDQILRVHGDYRKDAATSVKALSGMGELAMQKGDVEAGAKYFAEVLAVSPGDEIAAYNVGEILFSNQKTDEAIAYFEKAAQIKEDWPKPYYKLGFVYLNKGDFAKSLECFKKFVALDPSNPEVPKVKEIMAAVEKMKK